MTPADTKIFITLSSAQQGILLNLIGLRRSNTPTSADYTAAILKDHLHRRGFTMADILHTLHTKSSSSLTARHLLQHFHRLLLPTIPPIILPLLSPTLQRRITTIHSEFLSDPPPEYYHIGATVADIHLVYGIALQTIDADEAAGGIVLSSQPLYSPNDEEYAPPLEE